MSIIQKNPILGLAAAFVIGALISGVLVGVIINNTPTGEVVEIDITASQWAWDPSLIEVNLGDHVILHITATADDETAYGYHSFIMQKYNLSVDLPIDETTDVEFDATVAGEFTFECGVYCGTNHLDMRGTFVVKSASQDVGEEEEILTPSTTLFVDAGSWNNEELMMVIQRENRSVAFIDGTTHKILGTVNELGYQPHTAVYDDALDFAYLIGRGGWFIKIDLNTFEAVDWVKVGTSSRGTAITVDGKYVFISNYEPSSFVVVDTASMNIVKEFQVPLVYNMTSGEALPSRVAAIVDAPNNRIMVTLKDLGEVWVFNMNDTNSASDIIIERVFYDLGELLHDAFITKDGRYYMLASQGSDHIWWLDTWDLDNNGFIATEDKPHPGPGALWGKYAFSPSVGLGALNVWNMETFEFVKSIEVGGPGLFARSYIKDESYNYIWWDTILDADPLKNRMIHVLDVTTLNDTNPTVITLADANATLHPEFTFDGEFVYVSSWGEDKILVYDAHTLELITEITGLITPTGVFNLGLRIEEPGL
jgi:nitrite reductase (NO-forming)/hydroxylamine reductase